MNALGSSLVKNTGAMASCLSVGQVERTAHILFGEMSSHKIKVLSL